jgi:hypothetical protein
MLDFRLHELHMFGHAAWEIHKTGSKVWSYLLTQEFTITKQQSLSFKPALKTLGYACVRANPNQIGYAIVLLSI